MSTYDSWKTRSDRDEYPENYDPSWEEDVDLPGELYDEDEMKRVQQEINAMYSCFPVG